MKLRAFSVLSLALALPLAAVIVRADSIDIGTAAPFGVLGEAGVTNTGPTVVSGSVAGSTGTPAVTGFPPGSVVLPPRSPVYHRSREFRPGNAFWRCPGRIQLCGGPERHE